MPAGKRRAKRFDAEGLIVGGLTAVVLAMMVAPICMVVVISFTSGTSLAFPPPGWGLRWYESAWQLLTHSDEVNRLRESLVVSLGIAAVVMVVVTVVSIPAAYALARLNFRGKELVEQLVTLPLVFPLVVLGVSLLVLASELRIQLGFWRIVVAHVIITLPFVVRNCAASLRGIEPSLEEAAYVLGANWRRTFVEIVLPLMRPGILAGMVLAFIISFNEFTVTYFLYTVDTFPFPIWLFSRSNNSLDLVIFAISSVIIVINIALIWLLDRLVGKQGVTV
jgi:putative spermidine/putrescine transport system permease protein